MTTHEEPTMARERRSERPRAAQARVELDRRRFLAASGAGAAALAWGGGAAASLVAQTLPLSIGYVEDSDRLRPLTQLPWRTSRYPGLALPAAEIASGDTTMALAPLSVRIAGLYPDWPWPGKQRPRAIDLDVLFEPFDPYVPSPLPFLAWSFRRLPARNASPPVRFAIEMGEIDGLGLRLRVEDRSGRGYEYAGAFTVDDTPGLARLQRGIYLLGLYPDTFSRGREMPGLGETPDYSLRSIVLSVEAPALGPDPPER
jgi:hypothetical protein